jgi:hypothetical protein
MTTVQSQLHPNYQPSPGPLANAVGAVVPETSPNLSGSPPPTPKPETPKAEGWWKSWGSDVLHGTLDVIGLVPVLGEAANGVGALVYLVEGDPVSAAFDAAAMWPAGGQAATAGKYAAKAAVKLEKEVAQAAAKKLEKEAAEALEKKALKEAEQKAAKEAEQKAAKKKADEGGNVKGDCKHFEKGPPGAKYQGGKHGRVKEDSERGVRESHHIPPKSVSPNGPEVGPAISMDYADHRGLSSTGRRSTDAVSIAQDKLAKSGPAGFLLAMGTEIAEIRLKHGDKYDPAIAWMLLWAACMGYIPNPLSGKRK